jgi:hypothetical protein
MTATSLSIGRGRSAAATAYQTRVAAAQATDYVALPMRPACALSSLVWLAFAACVAACNLDNLGDPPPRADIYLPTGLGLSAQTPDQPPRFLYLINSNFDLRYNRGSLQAFDLERLNERVQSQCGAMPGLDCQIASQDLLVDEVLVPSLATTFTISADRKRFYVAARAEPSLTYIDLDEDADGDAVLRCDDSERRCSEARQRGADAAQSPRALTLPAEPVGMVTLPAAQADATTDMTDAPGGFVLTAHRAGQVSLFYDDGSAPPTLAHVVQNLPLEPTAIVFDPGTRLAYLSVYARGGLTGLSRLLSRVGVTVQGSLDASFLYDAGALAIDGVAAQRDTRAVTLNPADPRQLLVASRDPSALLYIDIARNDANELPTTNVTARHLASVGTGPSRMALGRLGDHDIVAVSCFDGHSLYILDALSADVLGIVHNLNGPFELAIDSARRRIYLADFRTSSVQVIDLSPIVQDPDSPRTDAPIIATLGIPKVVQELQ